MTSSPRSPKVVLTGDVTMDWNLARTRRLKEALPAWNADDRTRASWQRGGAAMLADLIEAVANTMRRDGQADWAVLKMGSPTEPVHPLDDRFHHSYAMWSQFSHGKGSGARGEESTWRVDELLTKRFGQEEAASGGKRQGKEKARSSVLEETPGYGCASGSVSQSVHITSSHARSLIMASTQSLKRTPLTSRV